MIITLRNDLAELPRLAGAVEEFSGAAGVPAKDVFELNLVLEELFTNIVEYAFDDHEPHTIRVRLELDGAAVRAEVRDEGRAFDPLAVPAPDLASDLAHRRVGGLGIHLVRSLTEDLAYDRRNGANHVTFRKPLSIGGS
jgi:anti-sigma regulatory factor (Ser/Thr protein kinase)